MANWEPFEENVDRYDNWFERHANLYRSELAAVRELLPEAFDGMEVGVGTGRFAAPLGIARGVEPSPAMRRLARSRGIDAVAGAGEHLPYPDATFDLVLMVTVMSFLDDVPAALAEARRVLRPGGALLIGFVDRQSPAGRLYEERKEESPFYREAEFLSADEVGRHLTEAGFRDLTYRQTLLGSPGDSEDVETPQQGHGRGSFVVVRATAP